MKCEACERGDHDQCGMQTWCKCDCEGWDGFEFRTAEYEHEDDFGEWETCWHCMGAGGFHNCGEDCCPCLEPELNEVCQECKGRGGWAI